MKILPQFTMFDQPQNEEVLGNLERFGKIRKSIGKYTGWKANI